MATALEIYVTGSLNLFNHRTNVDISNRIVCYDIKDLGKQMKKIGMLVVQDQVWGRVTQNRGMGKATRYFMDEFHLLLKEEQTASYSVEIWKRFRKWGGIPTGITQNVKDLLSSREVENIFENSDFIIIETLEPEDGDSADKPDVEKPAPKVNPMPALILVLVLLGGGGFFAYTKFFKGRKKEQIKPDPDADYTDEDDEDYGLPEDTDLDDEDGDGFDAEDDEPV